MQHSKVSDSKHARFQIEQLARLEIQRQHDIQVISQRALDIRAAIVLSSREQWRIDVEDNVLEEMFGNPVLCWSKSRPLTALPLAWSDPVLKQVLAWEMHNSNQQRPEPRWAHQELTLWGLLRSSKQEPVALTLGILQTCRQRFFTAFNDSTSKLTTPKLITRLPEIHRHYSAFKIQRAIRQVKLRQICKAKLNQINTKARRARRKARQLKLHREAAVLQAYIQVMFAKSQRVKGILARLAKRLAGYRIARWYRYRSRMKHARKVWNKIKLIQRVVSVNNYRHEKQEIIQNQILNKKRLKAMNANERAVLCIQCLYRGRKARQNAKRKFQAILTLQCAFRVWKAKKQVYFKQALAQCRNKRLRRLKWQQEREEFTVSRRMDKALVLMYGTPFMSNKD